MPFGTTMYNCIQGKDRNYALRGGKEINTLKWIISKSPGASHVFPLTVLHLIHSNWSNQT